MDNIFVQIAAYKDPQLVPTLNDMIAKAAHPELLDIVVCWQHGSDQTEEIFLDNGYKLLIRTTNELKHKIIHLKKNGCRVRLIDVPYTQSKGACWARNYIQQMYDGQKYTLQLDSHHRFVEGFDTILIDTLESVRVESPKPVLTAYVPSFDPENDPAGRVQTPWKMDFDRFIPEGAVFFMPASIDDWASRNGKPMKARFYSGHFTFADGSFAEEVQHDPEYFFHGEEISIAARAYTHGYDLYHPTTVIAWHEYTRKGRTKIWDDHTTTMKHTGAIKLDWVQRNDACHNRNRTLFGMDGLDPKSIDFGKYGFGNKRTLLEYEMYAGISFKYRGVQQDTLDKKEPPNILKYENEEQWKGTFVRSNDIRILFNKNELDEAVDDYDFWYVGCHDVDEKEIYRKDATPSDIRGYTNGEFYDFRLIFLSNIKPITYTVWVHSTSKGWLTKITKPVMEH